VDNGPIAPRGIPGRRLIGVRVPQDLYEYVEERARQEHWSVNLALMEIVKEHRAARLGRERLAVVGA
jgi:hypothetical protein